MADPSITLSRRLRTTTTETLILTNCIADYYELRASEQWSALSPFKSGRNRRTWDGNSWQSLQCTLLGGRDRKQPDRSMLELSLPHCRCQATWLHPWKADCDRKPSWSPIRQRHTSCSQLLSLSFKKKGSKSRQMSTFIRYKYCYLNANKGKPSLDARNTSPCYPLSIYFTILSITYIIAHCNSPFLLPLILNLYYAITNFIIEVHLTDIISVPPPPPPQISSWHVLAKHIFPRKY